jgi:hypothetical protein
VVTVNEVVAAELWTSPGSIPKFLAVTAKVYVPGARSG